MTRMKAVAPDHSESGRGWLRRRSPSRSFILVDQRIVVEVKSTHDLPRTSHRQLLAYLRGSDLEVGLLFHFGPKPEFYRTISTRKPQKQNRS